jgi:hypothetical protein
VRWQVNDCAPAYAAHDDDGDHHFLAYSKTLACTNTVSNARTDPCANARANAFANSCANACSDAKSDTCDAKSDANSCIFNGADESDATGANTVANAASDSNCAADSADVNFGESYAGSHDNGHNGHFYRHHADVDDSISDTELLNARALLHSIHHANLDFHHDNDYIDRCKWSYSHYYHYWRRRFHDNLGCGLCQRRIGHDHERCIDDDDDGWRIDIHTNYH